MAAEDNDFADLRGNLQRSSNCVVYVYVTTGCYLGGCTFGAKSLGEAGALYQTWLRNVQSALPHWWSVDLKRLPSGDVAGTVFSDSSQLHAVYVDIFSDPQSGYRVDTTFAKMSALRS